MTVGAYAVDWLRHASLTVRPSTLDFYRHSLAHLEPVADVPLTMLSTAHVRALMEKEAAAGRASRTIRGVVQTLALVLRQAMEDGIVERNVAQLVKKPALSQKQPEHFTAEQARRFLDATRGDPLYSLYAVALASGLRRGELLALTWRDVDLGVSVLNVRRSKTTAGVRRVPLAEFGRLPLEQLPRTPGPIWTASPSYVSRHFQDLCRAAGVPVLTFHSLRHSAASLMVDAGVPLVVVQSIMGHTKAAMTMHYARPGDELQRDAVEKLGAMVG